MKYIRSIKDKLCRACTMGICLGLFAFSALSFNATLNAYYYPLHQTDALELGIKLETEFWTLVQNQNVRGFSDKLASIFQGLNVSGVYTREQQIAGLTGATLINFSIDNPVATLDKDILVFSYDFIQTGDLTPGPSITVWKRYKNAWKIVSHSYVPFNP